MSLTQQSAAELARRIAAGEVSSVEVVEAFIRQIELVEPELNALVVPLLEQAQREARAADAARERGEPLGPLHGLPITIKDSFDLAGTPTTAGLAHRASQMATEDAPLVRRLREAGAIVLGKTNVPQTLLYIESDNPLYGRTNNPHALERTPGGSSGGEGAILAANGSTLGLGSDIGGSIRVPAHFCGVHGLKPTSGRLTIRGSADEWLFAGQEAILSQPGPLARRVEDLALAMRVLCAPGLEVIDSSVPPVPYAGPEAVRVEQLTVGVYDHDGFFPASPAIRRAVHEAAERLRERGARIVEFHPPNVDEAMRLFFGILSAAGPGHLGEMLELEDKKDRRIDALLKMTRMPGPVRATAAATARATGQHRLAHTLSSVRSVSAAGFWDLAAARNRYRVRFLAEMEARGADVLLCPPLALPALPHGDSYWLTSAASYAMLFNLLGMPAGVVSTTRVRAGEETDRTPSRDLVDRAARGAEQDSAGLPVGVQVAGRHWREDQVLAVMGAVEGDQ